jgi:hypothetical protein
MNTRICTRNPHWPAALALSFGNPPERMHFSTQMTQAMKINGDTTMAGMVTSDVSRSIAKCKTAVFVNRLRVVVSASCASLTGRISDFAGSSLFLDQSDLGSAQKRWFEQYLSWRT